VRGELRLFGQIDVRSQRDPVSVERHRVRCRQRLELFVFECLNCPAISISLDLARRWVDDKHSRRAVEDYVLVAIQLLRRVAKSYNCRQSQRPGQNCDMRRARARVGSDADDRLAIQLYRQARCQIVRHQDFVRAFWQIDWIVVGEPEQNRQHSDVYVDQVPDAFPHHGSHVLGELLPPLEQYEVECLFGAQVLVNKVLDLMDQLCVLEN
jgi:hypothetical protein